MEQERELQSTKDKLTEATTKFEEERITSADQFQQSLRQKIMSMDFHFLLSIWSPFKKEVKCSSDRSMRSET